MHPARVSSIVGALALLLTGTTGITAEVEPAPPAKTARLEVQALPECTTREELLARIAARSRRIRFDEDTDGGSTSTLRVAVAATPRHGAVGDLVIVGPDGRTSTRRLSAPTCAEATDALALIIALMLDPSAAITPTPPPPPLVVTPPPPRRVQPPAVVAAPPPALPHPAARRFGVGAAGQVLFGPSPAALPGFALWALAGLDRDSLWSPVLLLAWIHAFDSGLGEKGGTAGFTLDAASLDACPLRLRALFMEARACGTALVGRLIAGGSETYSPTAIAQPYAALGGALMVVAGPWRHLEVVGRFGAAASLVRDSFQFLPYTFHRTDAVTLSGSLGIGIRFP